MVRVEICNNASSSGRGNTCPNSEEQTEKSNGGTEYLQNKKPFLNEDQKKKRVTWSDQMIAYLFMPFFLIAFLDKKCK